MVNINNTIEQQKQLELKAKELEQILVSNYNAISEKDKEEIISLTTLAKSRMEIFKLKQEVKELKKESEEKELVIKDLESEVEQSQEEASCHLEALNKAEQ